MPTLSWLTREKDVKRADGVAYRLLERDSALSVGDTASGNMLIQGDNLEALKSLLPYYRGQVKCIYIDPPYNTRSAFEHYDDNLEHSQWLAMIWPRLVLLRELLAEDGSIWVSIDDNEGHYLKVIMDEVFGRRNFVTNFIWQKVDSPNDNKVPITPDHEFVLCYEKVRDTASFRQKADDSLLDAYKSTPEEPRLHRDRLIKKNGKNSLRADRPTMYYPIIAPDDSEAWPIHDDGREARWAFGKDGVQQLRAEGRLIWKRRQRLGEDVWVPYSREFASQSPTRPHPTILLDVKTTRQAKAHARGLLPDIEPIETIKPEEIIERVLEIATSPSDIVLDSFLGSGTTAAVAHKMGRRWIGIEMGDHAVTHCAPRLKKVIDGEQGGISQSVGWQGGGGFAFYRLGEAVFDGDGAINPGIAFAPLAAHVWFSETGVPFVGKSSPERGGGSPFGLTEGPVSAESRSSKEARVAPGPSTGFAGPPPRSGEDLRSPFLGHHDGRGLALLYNGILGDKRVSGGNVLTRKTLTMVRAGAQDFTGPITIYGEASRLSPETLKAEGIIFKQTPYDVRAR